MAIKCCYKCVPPERHTACWDTCPKYIKEKAIHDQEKAAVRKQKDIDNGIMTQKMMGVYRAKRRNKPKQSGWKRGR